MPSVVKSRVWKGVQSPFLVHYNSGQNNFDQFDVTAMELDLSGFLYGKNTQQNCLGADKNLQINNILLFLFDSKNRFFFRICHLQE